MEGFRIDHHRIAPVVGLDLEIVSFVKAVVKAVPRLKSRREPFLEIIPRVRTIAASEVKSGRAQRLRMLRAR
ncbi:hypothetical protein DUT91_23360 [Phyllobacterium salinisoli]|uniref:Uncharacterized protein n=1 Tax=Phyllobacterium salinisoli TaxID=1899321 RepID=A0A368JZE7_9HYPH|nr:hypothetical protein DUT91_23360 [Phyllobacterium salinisoli]